MFRGLNGLRSGIKGHVGPTWIKKNKKKSIYQNKRRTDGDVETIFDFFSFYLLKFSFLDSRVSNRQNSSG